MHSPLARTTDDHQILHIVAGDSAAGTLLQTTVPCSANILRWGDSLLFGPVPDTNSLEEMSRIRSRYLRKPSPLRAIDPSVHEYRFRPLAPRDRLLRRCHEWQEVALWFGPGAREQLSLVQVLTALSQQSLGKTRVTLVTCARYAMGAHNPEQFAMFFLSRTPLRKELIKLSKRVWALYCSADPMPLFRFAKRLASSNQDIADSLMLQVEEYPSTQDGLSVLEQTILASIAAPREFEWNRLSKYRGTVLGAITEVLAGESSGHFGPGWQFGDQVMSEMIWRFLRCPVPLLKPVRGSIQDIDCWRSFCRLKVKLTPAGQAVLDCRDDNIALNGIDRWIAGVHLKGKRVKWRWDREKQILRKSAD